MPSKNMYVGHRFVDATGYLGVNLMFTASIVLIYVLVYALGYPSDPKQISTASSAVVALLVTFNAVYWISVFMEARAATQLRRLYEKVLADLSIQDEFEIDVDTSTVTIHSVTVVKYGEFTPYGSTGVITMVQVVVTGTYIGSPEIVTAILEFDENANPVDAVKSVYGTMLNRGMGKTQAVGEAGGE